MLKQYAQVKADALNSQKHNLDNLDAQDNDALQSYCDVLQEVSDLYAKLAEYADLKRNAQIIRATDNPSALFIAINNEKWCDEIYRELPDEVKW